MKRSIILLSLISKFVVTSTTTPLISSVSTCSAVVFSTVTVTAQASTSSSLSPSSSSIVSSSSSIFSSSSSSSSSSTSSSISSSISSSASSGPSTVQFACPYSYVGCFNELPNGRALNGASNKTVTSVEDCAAFCLANGGTEYFGVEYYSECYCGDAIDVASTPVVSVSPNQCNYACYGSPNEYCGGPSVLDIYSKQKGSGSCSSSIKASVSSSTSSAAISSGTGISSSSTASVIASSNIGSSSSSSSASSSLSVTLTGPQTVQTALRYVYQGCYNEPTYYRVLGGASNGSVTGIEDCAAFCTANGATTYMGVEYYSQCFCGNTLQYDVPVTPTQANQCNLVCYGNADEYCGGAGVLDLYILSASASSSSVSSSTLLSSFSSSPTISSSSSSSFDSSSSPTISSSASSSIGSSSIIGSSASSSSFSGSSISSLTLSSSSTATGPQTVQTALPYVYQGCYNEPTAYRILGGASNTTVTGVEDCAAFCTANGATAYIGVEYYSQCFCGNTIQYNVPVTPSQSNQCDYVCYGSPNEYCGGAAVMDLYVLSSFASSSSSSTISSLTSSSTLTLSASSSSPVSSSGVASSSSNSIPSSSSTYASSTSSSVPSSSSSTYTSSTTSSVPSSSSTIIASSSSSLTTTATGPTTVETAGIYSYVGCYNEPTYYRALGGASNGTVTGIEDCASFCLANGDTVYFGVEYYSQCFCGDTLQYNVSVTPTQANQCNYVCYGSPNEYCGGLAVFDLYSRGSGTLASSLSSIVTSSASSSLVTSSSSNSGSSASSSFSSSASASTLSSASSTALTSSTTSASSSSSSIITSTASGPTTVQSAGTYNYVGCYNEPTSYRALGGASNQSVTSVEDCANFCTANGFTEFFGIEYYSQCFCGNSLLYNVSVTSTQSNQCTYICYGNSNEFCGGLAVFDLYQRNYVGSSSSSSVSVSSLSSSLASSVSVSSSVSSSSSKSSASASSSSSSSTSSSTSSASASSPTSSSTSSSTSSASASSPTSSSTSSSTSSASASSPTSSSTSSSTSSASASSSASKSSSSTTASASQSSQSGSVVSSSAPASSSSAALTILTTVGNYRYVGCYTGAGVSVLNNSLINLSLGLPALCATTCIGYNFIGIANGGDCYCSNTVFTGAAVDTTGSSCNKACTGAVLNVCGGVSGTLIYESNLAISASVSPGLPRSSTSLSTSISISSSASSSSSATTSSHSSSSTSSSSSSSSIGLTLVKGLRGFTEPPCATPITTDNYVIVLTTITTTVPSTTTGQLPYGGQQTYIPRSLIPSVGPTLTVCLPKNSSISTASPTGTTSTGYSTYVPTTYMSVSSLSSSINTSSPNSSPTSLTQQPNGSSPSSSLYQSFTPTSYISSSSLPPPSSSPTIPSTDTQSTPLSSSTACDGLYCNSLSQLSSPTSLPTTLTPPPTSTTSTSYPNGDSTSIPPTIVPTAGAYLYVGCYNEPQTYRILGGAFNSTIQSVYDCANFCSANGNTIYFGVEYYTQCFCGNELQYNSPISPDQAAQCNYECYGSTTEACGGQGVLALYEISSSISYVSTVESGYSIYTVH